MRLIDADAWDGFYKKKTDKLEQYDHYDLGYWTAIDNVDDWVSVQPTIDAVEVVHGRWELVEFQSSPFGLDQEHQCSICGTPADFEFLTRYCPNCGAKMDLEV